MDLFPDTKWTILAEATLNGDESGREALGEICMKYKDSVDKIILSKGVSVERVEDVRQDFFVNMMEGSFFKKATKERGKFRAFLLNALKNFLVDDYRKLSAEKRGGNREHVKLEENAIITETDKINFDLAWAEALFDSAMEQVGLVIQEKRGLDEWKALKQFLSGNLADQSYEKLAGVLDLSIGGAKAEVSRMRSKFRTQLRTEVSQTVSAPHEIDEELRYLKEAMIRVWGV